jgi:DNA-binding MarR family transcriptional regulator
VPTAAAKKELERPADSYVLERQIGFLLRQATQRHAAEFASGIRDDITPPQLSALVKLLQNGTCWQTQLGRLTGMDVATMKGVVDRLVARGLVETKADPSDGRRMLLKLSRSGRSVAERAREDSISIHKRTLKTLNEAEQEQLIAFLSKLISEGDGEEA